MAFDWSHFEHYCAPKTLPTLGLKVISNKIFEGQSHAWRPKLKLTSFLCREGLAIFDHQLFSQSKNEKKNFVYIGSEIFHFQFLFQISIPFSAKKTPKLKFLVARFLIFFTFFHFFNVIFTISNFSANK